MAGMLCNSPSAVTGSTAYCDAGATAALTATGSAGGLTANGAIGSPGVFSPTAVPLTLQNVWAVRAIGGTSTGTTVGIGLGTATTLNGPTPATIVISTPTVSTTPVTSGNNTTAVTFPDPGLGTAQQGNVGLNLNLSNATNSGLYSSGAGATGDSNYILTVTGT